MNASSFHFTMTLPGDRRLVGAIRDLTVHAAKYAQLPDEAAAGLTEQVVSAATAVIEATERQGLPIECRFVCDEGRLEVRLVSEAPVRDVGELQTNAPAGLTVDWSREGARQTCVVAQRIPA
jgi:hypothetical protein